MNFNKQLYIPLICNHDPPNTLDAFQSVARLNSFFTCSERLGRPRLKQALQFRVRGTSKICKKAKTGDFPAKSQNSRFPRRFFSRAGSTCRPQDRFPRRFFSRAGSTCRPQDRFPRRFFSRAGSTCRPQDRFPVRFSRGTSCPQRSPLFNRKIGQDKPAQGKSLSDLLPQKPGFMQIPFPQFRFDVWRWGREIRERLDRVIPSAQRGAMWGFALRNWLASMLAFYLASVAELDSPHWAWLTVWIVAQPTPGMVLSKSLYRVIGTIAGSCLGILLIALFAQTPEFFVVALALLVGVCTYFSQMLTNFRAYATVLAAYTAGIVASDAIDTPDQVFFIAMARMSCILIGIGSSIVITSLFAPHRAQKQTLDQIKIFLKTAALRAEFSWRGDNHERLRIGRKLIQDGMALDTLIEFAAAESGQFRLQATSARSLIAHVFGMISARRALDAHLIRNGWPRHHVLNVFHEVIIDFLQEMPRGLDQEKIDELHQRVEEICSQLKSLQPEQETSAGDELISERFVIDRLHDLLIHIKGALIDWRDIRQNRWVQKPALALNFHRDLRAAKINGLRAFVAVCVTGAFWIASAWPDGPSALVFVCILMSLFSSQPHPDRVGWTFFYAGSAATVVALFCKFYVLPNVTNYESLVLILGFFLLPLGLFMAYPATAAAAVSFSLVFLNLVQIANPMTYDLAATINSSLAILVGVLFGTLAYTLLFPPNPQAARRYVTHRIQLGLELLARRQPIPKTSTWETRMYDRVLRLNDPQNLSSTPTDEWLDAGLGALNVGNEILRLRAWLSEESIPPVLRQRTEAVIAAFADFLHHPLQAEAALQQTTPGLKELDPGLGQPQREVWARLSGALWEMQLYLAEHPRLLNKPLNE